MRVTRNTAWSIENPNSRRDGQTSTRVLILTTFDLDEYVYGALRAGDSGFLLKDVLSNQPTAGVRMVVAGDTLLAPTITRRLSVGTRSRRRRE
jgi:DNA-binding NarL/FixJ family response regulator